MELGERYGMAGKVDNNGDGIMKEWYDQTKAFEAYVVGKTAAEVEAIETQTNDHGYLVPVDETLLASCTMQITGMMAVIARAAEFAR